jgi:L-ascorbate metabolism protein UlaG (beta-lactamase superfamily)
MRISWFGQSAFLLAGAQRVMIDPFGFSERLRERGFRYPPIRGVQADLVLVTHEHVDHNAVEVVEGSPPVIRSTAGRLESPVGEVVAVASEHDREAGTRRGPNTIFVLSLGGLRVCHMGDFGQDALRPEQRRAIGAVDLLFVPVGGGPTVDGREAARLVRELAPRLIVPMHFETAATDFLEAPDAFLDEAVGTVARLEGSEVEVEPLLGSREDPVVALLDAPLGDDVPATAA